MARSLRIRWLSAVLGALLVLSGILVLATQALSSPNLPPVTPRQLIASVVRASERPPPISGEVSVRFDLGLPSLPSEVSGPSSGPATLLAYLTGGHRLRVWRSADGVRVAELLSAGERALFVSRSDAWAWDSLTFTAYQLGPFPARALLHGTGYGAEGFPLGIADPERLAELSFQAVSPSTAVSVGPNLRVAGRDAYSLVLAPRSPDTLVGRIVISVDAKQRVPLGAEVFPRGSDKAAISAEYTAVSFAPIARSTFDFVPPKGARVERPNQLPPDVSPGGIFTEPEPGAAFAQQLPRVFGTGWGTILALPLPSSADLSRASGEARAIISSLLPFSGTLFSARLVDRGDHQWLLVGAVPQSALAKVQTELS